MELLLLHKTAKEEQIRSRNPQIAKEIGYF